ncbi:major facilitator superfamily MFS_1 [Desulfatibacillum aliphaticivorans]|uniref:Major facilitator superfamily MFS_1 n=1 Tax=Desulfatibacillum aliphaticivorans TaxID=218208 RepID=B8FLW8_DESAL|nr:MFS transporter [Desulfatibacillum aliphaticivorans]ACL05701.1 major facilitator superfamily MFS_1 [Desulfatibacillum aliphaticivorans]
MSQLSDSGFSGDKLFTQPFAVLLIVYFMIMCNLAVFFNFFSYLEQGGVSAKTAGLLLGVFPLVALAARPMLSSRVHPGNAAPWCIAGAVGMAASLSAYAFVQDVWLLAVLRGFHGLAFVIGLTALISLTVSVVPPLKSGQAFGAITVANLFPYAIMPPAVEYVLAKGGTQGAVFMGTGIVMAAAPPFLWLVSRMEAFSVQERPKEEDVLSRREVLDNFKSPVMLFLLAMSGAAYLCFAMVFYFLKSYGGAIAIQQVGHFFTLTIIFMIGVRVAAFSFFDRWNKARVCGVGLIYVGLCFCLLGTVRSPWLFFGSGALLGLGWGITMPLIGALIFDASPPRLRSFNTNMMIEMIDGGYFLAPTMGAAIASSLGYSALLYFEAGVSVLFGIGALGLARKI